MAREELVNLLVKRPIDKARKQNKNPFEILEGVKLLIELKRTIDCQKIIKAVSKEVSVN